MSHMSSQNLMIEMRMICGILILVGPRYTVWDSARGITPFLLSSQKLELSFVRRCDPVSEGH